MQLWRTILARSQRNKLGNKLGNKYHGMAATTPENVVLVLRNNHSYVTPT